MRSTAKRLRSIDPYDYRRAFSRNLGIVSEAEQELLRTKHVAIPGCGGVGSIHALTLARMGIGHFTIADFDTYQIENTNRQFAAKHSTFGKSKVEVVRDEILDINPTANVRIFNEPVNPENIDAFLKGVDVVVDSLDFFAFEARDLVFPEAQRRGIFLVTAAPLGLSCALLIFSDDSMSYENYFNFLPSDSKMQRALKFAMGLAPKALHAAYMDVSKIDLEGGKGPSHAIGVVQCAAMAANEVMKILLGRGKVRVVPHFVQFDLYRARHRRGYLLGGNRNPWQQFKMWFITKFILKRSDRASG